MSTHPLKLYVKFEAGGRKDYSKNNSRTD